MSNEALAYLILRISLGVNILIHGLVRIPHYQTFVDNLVHQFQPFIIPQLAVNIFAHLLPFLEAAIGLLLLLGLWTRTAAVAGGFLIAVLIFGSGLKQDWNVVGTQMVYVLPYFFAILYLKYNTISIDNLIGRRYP
jgi:thiosulfate dehydrogenase (quinone) large subunit